jgi:hypothetical protein
MQVVYTISGTLTVPDNTPLENLRDAVLDALSDRIITESQGAGKTLKTILDEDLVEYDVIEENPLIKSINAVAATVKNK